MYVTRLLIRWRSILIISASPSELNARFRLPVPEKPSGEYLFLQSKFLAKTPTENHREYQDSDGVNEFGLNEAPEIFFKQMYVLSSTCEIDFFHRTVISSVLHIQLALFPTISLSAIVSPYQFYVHSTKTHTPSKIVQQCEEWGQEDKKNFHSIGISFPKTASHSTVFLIA